MVGPVGLEPTTNTFESSSNPSKQLLDIASDNSATGICNLVTVYSTIYFSETTQQAAYAFLGFAEQHARVLTAAHPSAVNGVPLFFEAGPADLQTELQNFQQLGQGRC